jgi:uncharacterized membrane protein
MSEQTGLHLVIGTFEDEAGAEEALNRLKASQDEELIGIQAAVALHKDEVGQIHFRDVGLTPAKGAAGGVVLGAVVGILTGGTGLALGALGALVGGLAGRKKRDSRFPAERVNQLAAALAPGSSAALIVMDPGWAVVIEERLGLMGAAVLAADIPAGVAEQSQADQEAAYAALVSQLRNDEESRKGNH